MARCGVVVYIYARRGLSLGSGRANGKGEWLGEVGGYTTGCGGGRYIRACAGGIAVVYLAAGLKFEEETSKMLHLEHGFVWC
jgi:hypothetical protein